MKIKPKKLLLCIAIPIIVGIASGFISMGGMKDFGSVKQPALAPPSVLFPIVWGILYVLMGIASYIIISSPASGNEISGAIKLYGLQLVFNFLWSIIFFNARQYCFAFIWLIVLWLLIAATIRSFYDIERIAAYLLIPYLLWVTFAGYLNLGIAILN